MPFYHCPANIKYLAAFCLGAIICLFPLFSQDSNENTARLAYRLGINALLEGEPQKARSYFEQASAQEGKYASSARIELVQLMAAGQGEKNDPGAIRQILLSFQEKDQAPAGWIAVVHALEQNSRVAEALELAEELYLRFPRSDYAADALIVAARILYYERRMPAAALERLYTLLTSYPQSNVSLSAYALLSKIYLASGKFHNSARGCRFLRLYKQKSEINSGYSIEQELNTFCGSP